MSTSLLFFLLGLGPDTCVALLSINIHFLEICVLAEISLFFFLNYITRIEGPSNLDCIVEILYTILFELSWFPNCVVGVGGAHRVGPMAFVI